MSRDEFVLIKRGMISNFNITRREVDSCKAFLFVNDFAEVKRRIAKAKDAVKTAEKMLTENCEEMRRYLKIAEGRDD